MIVALFSFLKVIHPFFRFVMKITANENDTNDILQTFRSLLLSSSVHCKLNSSDLAASSYGQSGEKRREK